MLANLPCSPGWVCSSTALPNPPHAEALPHLAPQNEAAFIWDGEFNRPDIKFFAFITGDNMFLKWVSLRSPRQGPYTEAGDEPVQAGESPAWGAAPLLALGLIIMFPACRVIG